MKSDRITNMNIDFGRIIASGRALLRWDQQTLADYSGVNCQTIIRIEKGNNANQATKDSIRKAFEMNNIALTEHGAIWKENRATELKGDDWFMSLLNDIHSTLHNSTEYEELLLDGANDEKSPQHVIDKYHEMRADGIEMRQLVAERPYIIFPEEEYRCIPEHFFTNLLMVIYGEKIAIELGDHSGCTVYNDPALAMRMRKSFEAQWAMYKRPDQT